MSYVDWFLDLKSAPLLLQARLNWTEKEISESAGLVKAMATHDTVASGRHLERTVFCIGDGTYPRTGALAAVMDGSQVHSIDPKLKSLYFKEPQEGVSRAEHSLFKRLTLWGARVEKTPLESLWGTFNTVLLCHSHAPFAPLWKRLPKETMVIGLPCCTSYECDQEPDLVYDDERILSPKRTIMIWRKR